MGGLSLFVLFVALQSPLALPNCFSWLWIPGSTLRVAPE
jgi:hypothetical protein